MRNSWLILPFLLTACGSGDSDQERSGAGTVPVADPLGNLAAGVPVPDAAALQQLVQQAMPAEVAGGAQFRNVRAGSGGSACGEVATKAGSAPAGTFRPFVVTPEGVAVIAATPKIAFDDPADPVVDAYIRWCASPEELQRLPSVLAKSTGDPPPAPPEDVPLPTPFPPDPSPPPAAAPLAATPPPAQPAKPAPPPRIDSFFNSVQRKEP
ncbi:MAG TPA: hypothetical protein VF727_10365 [Allosphingosinicella sp.]|jgi:hypothetical protein